MKHIKTFVQKNKMTVMVAAVVMVFGTWMYTAHQNMVARDAQRQARIEQVIANGGSYHPSAELYVDKKYVTVNNE